GHDWSPLPAKNGGTRALSAPLAGRRTAPRERSTSDMTKLGEEFLHLFDLLGSLATLFRFFFPALQCCLTQRAPDFRRELDDLDGLLLLHLPQQRRFTDFIMGGGLPDVFVQSLYEDGADVGWQAVHSLLVDDEPVRRNADRGLDVILRHFIQIQAGRTRDRAPVCAVHHSR